MSASNWALFVEEGAEGKSCELLRSAERLLNEVIDRDGDSDEPVHPATPTLAERLGVVLEGVNFLDFMLRLDDSRPPLFIDPFHAGEFLDRRGCEGGFDLTHHPSRSLTTRSPPVRRESSWPACCAI